MKIAKSRNSRRFIAGIALTAGLVLTGATAASASEAPAPKPPQGGKGDMVCKVIHDGDHVKYICHSTKPGKGHGKHICVIITKPVVKTPGKGISKKDVIAHSPKCPIKGQPGTGGSTTQPGGGSTGGK